MQEKIIVNDVGPRDGLQNQAKNLSPAQRLGLIESLLDAGLTHIEVGSFVSPKAVPQMAGCDEIVAGLPDRKDVEFSVLIPNLKGYELSRASGVSDVGLILSATDTMSERNINMNREQVFAVVKEILQRCRADGVRSMAIISVVFECPFEGKVEPEVSEELTARLFDAGADKVVIADTIGAAQPAEVSTLMSRLVNTHGSDVLACHFHDTRAMALANVYAALEAGIRRFDSSVGGLGGCPFAPGASGNLATEDLVMMVEQMGFQTGIDLGKLLDAADLVSQLTGSSSGGRSRPWLNRRLGRAA